MRFLAGLLLTLLLAAATVIGLLFAIPDGNDLAGGYADKMRRLEATEGPKIIFTGGSNLMYGLDSEVVESASGYPVVNLGLNGYLGPSFLLEQAFAHAAAGDLVVVGLEYEAYFQPSPYPLPDGVALDQLMVAKVYPDALGFVSGPAQLFSVLREVPHAVQLKLRRLITSAISVGDGGDEQDTESVFLSTMIETREGLNARGDLESHLGVDWPFEFGPIASVTSVDEPTLLLLSEYRARAEAMGVRLAIAPPPATEAWYRENRQQVEALYAALGSAFAVLGAPEAYVWPEEAFFDNGNHLRAKARGERSDRLAALVTDLLEASGADE